MTAFRPPAAVKHRWRALLLLTAFLATDVAVANAAQALSIAPPAGPPILPVQPAPKRCSRITSFSPASARPGEEVDIAIEPGIGPTINSPINGVTFANGVAAASFTVVSYTRVRARVPLAASTGHLRVTCRGLLGNFVAESATDFSPIAFGQTLQPNALTLIVGNSAQVTATLSHPAPEPLTLTIAPASNRVAAGGQAPGSPATATIATGQRSAAFTVAAQSGGGTSVTVSGHNVASATLPVAIPIPEFGVTIPVTNADAHWGNTAQYSVELASRNGFAGAVTLTAQNLPFGATAAPVTVNVPVNGSTTATLTVATVRGATDLGPNGFSVVAASPGVASVTRSLNLRVLPAAETFHDLDWLEMGDSCGGGVAATFDAAQQRVTFSGNGFQNTSFDAFMYAFTRDGSACRGAVVLGPPAPGQQGASVVILNFGFDGQIADSPGNSSPLGTTAYDETKFLVSNDASYLIAVNETMTGYNANLYNMLVLNSVGTNRSYNINETLGASVVGHQVVLTRPPGANHTWDLP